MELNFDQDVERVEINLMAARRAKVERPGDSRG